MAAHRTIAEIYRAFKFGANLTTDDVRERLASRDIDIGNNRLREFSHSSDRGGTMTTYELHALISAWADRQRPRDRA